MSHNEKGVVLLENDIRVESGFVIRKNDHIVSLEGIKKLICRDPKRAKLMEEIDKYEVREPPQASHGSIIKGLKVYNVKYCDTCHTAFNNRDIHEHTTKAMDGYRVKRNGSNGYRYVRIDLEEGPFNIMRRMRGKSKEIRQVSDHLDEQFLKRNNIYHICHKLPFDEIKHFMEFQCSDLREKLIEVYIPQLLISTLYTIKLEYPRDAFNPNLGMETRRIYIDNLLRYLYFVCMVVINYQESFITSDNQLKAAEDFVKKATLKSCLELVHLLFTAEVDINIEADLCNDWVDDINSKFASIFCYLVQGCYRGDEKFVTAGTRKQYFQSITYGVKWCLIVNIIKKTGGKLSEKQGELLRTFKTYLMSDLNARTIYSYHYIIRLQRLNSKATNNHSDLLVSTSNNNDIIVGKNVVNIYKLSQIILKCNHSFRKYLKELTFDGIQSEIIRDAFLPEADVPILDSITDKTLSAIGLRQNDIKIKLGDSVIKRKAKILQELLVGMVMIGGVVPYRVEEALSIDILNNIHLHGQNIMLTNTYKKTFVFNELATTARRFMCREVSECIVLFITLVKPLTIEEDKTWMLFHGVGAARAATVIDDTLGFSSKVARKVLTKISEQIASKFDQKYLEVIDRAADHSTETLDNFYRFSGQEDDDASIIYRVNEVYWDKLYNAKPKGGATSKAVDNEFLMPELKEIMGVAHKGGGTGFRKRQFEVMYALLERGNSIYIAPTGSGKTHLLKLYSQLAFKQTRKYIVIIAPFHELKKSMHQSIPNSQILSFKEKVRKEQIIISPLEGISSKTLTDLIEGQSVQRIIYDEIHILFSDVQVRGDKILDLQNFISKASRLKVSQTFMTATLRYKEHRHISQLLHDEPVNIVETPIISPKVDFYFRYNKKLGKDDIYHHFIGHAIRMKFKKLIVFLPYVEELEVVEAIINEHLGEYKTVVYHLGNRSPIPSTAEKLAIIATSALSTGIDIPNVDACFVLLRATPTLLIQQCGRCGRNEVQGHAYLLLNGMLKEDDTDWSQIKDFRSWAENYFNPLLEVAADDTQLSEYANVGSDTAVEPMDIESGSTRSKEIQQSHSFTDRYTEANLKIVPTFVESSRYGEGQVYKKQKQKHPVEERSVFDDLGTQSSPYEKFKHFCGLMQSNQYNIWNFICTSHGYSGNRMITRLKLTPIAEAYHDALKLLELSYLFPSMTDKAFAFVGNSSCKACFLEAELKHDSGPCFFRSYLRMLIIYNTVNNRSGGLGTLLDPNRGFSLLDRYMEFAEDGSLTYGHEFAETFFLNSVSFKVPEEEPGLLHSMASAVLSETKYQFPVLPGRVVNNFRFSLSPNDWRCRTCLMKRHSPDQKCKVRVDILQFLVGVFKCDYTGCINALLNITNESAHSQLQRQYKPFMVLIIGKIFRTQIRVADEVFNAYDLFVVEYVRLKGELGGRDQYAAL